MLTSKDWRERAKDWRVMAESGDDQVLRSELRVLAIDADAIVAEMEQELAGETADNLIPVRRLAAS